MPPLDPLHAFYCRKEYLSLAQSCKVKSGGTCARCGRSEMDAAVCNYALIEYMRHRGKNLSRLMAYAEKMRLEKRIRETMGVLF